MESLDERIPYICGKTEPSQLQSNTLLENKSFQIYSDLPDMNCVILANDKDI